MTRTVVVEIDGEQVTLECMRLTVRSYGEVMWLTGIRGSKLADEPHEAVLRRIQVVDAYVWALPGHVAVDGKSYTAGLAHLFASRSDVVAILYGALVQAQQVSSEQASDLELAARFGQWLGHQPDDASSHWVKTGTSCFKCKQLQLCERRGCDGQEKKRVVWYDKKFIMHVCPILSFTPEVEETLRLFYWSHQMMLDRDGSRWQQRHLVYPGALIDQDAWLVAAFSFLRHVHVELLKESSK